MCLYKLNKIPRIALKDKFVYKLIYKDFYGFKRTIAQKEFIKLGETYKGVFKEDYKFYNYFIKNKILSFLYSLFCSKTITSGYIHSFLSYKDALNIFKFTNGREILVKCIIPKGTIYFLGKHNDIASRKLKYTKNSIFYIDNDFCKNCSLLESNCLGGLWCTKNY